MGGKSKFCVITTQRSGSTWLSTLLDSHPQIKAFEEPFIWRKERPNWHSKHLPTYYDYKSSFAIKSPAIMFKYLSLLDTYDDGDDFDVIGFKIMYDQIANNPEILPKLVWDKYRLIHLVRENYLDILISKAAHKQHGILHSNLPSAQKKSKKKQVILEPTALIDNLEKCDRNYKFFRTFLKILPLPVLEITYESLAADQNKVLSSVSNFLQVDSTSITFTSNLKRVNKGVYAEKIANYEQIMETLKDSRFANLAVG